MKLTPVLFLFLLLNEIIGSIVNIGDLNKQDKLALENFREYVRIPSVQPNPDYEGCVQFLYNQAQSLGLPIKVYYMTPKKPIIIITWKGKNPSLPSILLNSHMDVVPVNEKNWSYGPFSADLDNGNVYGRGTQDMKSVGIQYLEAVRRLKENNVTLERTVHLSFVPDEEVEGREGMGMFIGTQYFKDLNVGGALDEGAPSASDFYVVYYGDRTERPMFFNCTGQSGHGSFLTNNTAGEKVTYILNKVFEYRAAQNKMLEENDMNIGDVTTINLTKMKGGTETNVVPSEFDITLDCRVAVTENITEWENMVFGWAKQAGPDVTVTFLNRPDPAPITKLDSSNIYWAAFKKATDEMGLVIKPQMMPGVTDGGRFLRPLGISVFEFSPISNTKITAHGDNEFLGINTFLNGIQIYYNIIIQMGNIGES